MKFKIIILGYCVLALVSFVGCSSDNKNIDGNINTEENLQTNNISYVDITGDEALKIINSKRDVVILDVRTSDEYKEGYIYTAVNIPLDELETRIDEINEFKNKDIMVYCKSGNRSTIASQILSSNGFENVFNMVDGVGEYNYELAK